MRNSFGLKLLHKFFNLPFLALQRDSLLKQLDTNLQEMSLTNEELDLYLETDDASYDKYIKTVNLSINLANVHYIRLSFCRQISRSTNSKTTSNS
jgi:predicted transglutaminase-like protease